tara:strand:- start:254 stop:469 length:216 start_codon:yes stop_codon:yes gene_type:complete
MGKNSRRELPEYDDEKCVLCGENVADTWAENQIQEIEEQSEMFPAMSDIIRLCFDCYNRLDARLPYRASLN